MSALRRKCIVTFDGEQFEGRFEALGQEQRFTESNDSYPVTVAIIEKLDGQVVTVPPAAVRFVKD